MLINILTCASAISALYITPTPIHTPIPTPIPQPIVPQIINKFTILHTNDIHAHLDEFNWMGGECKLSDHQKNQCYGGISRIKTLVDSFRANTSDVLLLDSGDQFQGTLFFNFFGCEAISEVMNLLKYDLMTIGNHEFDRGVEYLADFFRSLDFPVVSSNIDFQTALPLLQAGVQPYVILPKYNLGIIGYITNTTSYVTKGAQNVLFSDPVEPVQKYVDELHSKGIKRIICVSHNGYKEDQYLAENTRGISLIVGGHSHSLLLKNLSMSGVEGPYPTEVKNLDGKSTWVLQAHRFGDYLGHVDLVFEGDDLVSLTGDPILLNYEIAQNTFFQRKVDIWRKTFQKETETVLTIAKRDFDRNDCKKSECALGDLIADALLDHVKNDGVSVSLINSGGLRSSFSEGNVTVADVMTVLPFINVLAVFNYTGQDILDTLERIGAMRDKITNRPVVSNAQWAGMEVTFDMKAPNYQRVKDCKIAGEALNLTRIYKIVTNDFVVEGGDAILPKNEYEAGDDMSEVVIEYLKGFKEISPETHGRRLLEE